MKNKFRFLVVFLALLTSGLVLDLEAAGKEGEWVRIPSSWLLHRFVRPSTAPAHTYKVALALPIVTLSTGNHAVDRYFLHNSALNWQTTSKSSKIQRVRTPIGAAAPQRWQSILDH
jgi:hypothetical protein